MINDHNCIQICVEVEGSFSCSCYPGYELQDDGATCESKHFHSSQHSLPNVITYLVYVSHLHGILYCIVYGIVKSRYEGDIVVITQSRGGAEAEGNNNDITRVNGI